MSRALLASAVALPALLCAGAARAQSIDVTQAGDDLRAVVEQTAAPGSALRLAMQGQDHGIYLRQVGAGHQADVRLAGTGLGSDAAPGGGDGGRAGRIEQLGAGQSLAFSATGSDIGFELRQQGGAGNRLEARLDGDGLVLDARQLSFDPMAPQLLSLVSTGSGNVAGIEQRAGEGAAAANRIRLSQDGEGLRANFSQHGAGNRIEASQTGSRNGLDIRQTGDFNTAEVRQDGHDLATPTITQSGGARVVVTVGHGG